MVSFHKIASAITLAACLGSAVAHPGEHHDHEDIQRQVRVRDRMASTAKRSIDSCSNSLKHREVSSRSLARRAAIAKELRQRRNIQAPAKKYRRDLATLEIYEAINHNETGISNYTISTPETTIFGANTSCILTPLNTDGPYYVTGEQIRKNVTEDQVGVPLYLEVQYLDITTCLPVPDVYVDIWNCNATGVYGYGYPKFPMYINKAKLNRGINVTGNVADGGYNSTFLRGIQPTDFDGVAAFETIFPGHYDGRAIHTHLLAHMNVTVNNNNTISAGSVTHIGQLFWNEELRSAVEATYPYNTNTQAIVSNADDRWSIVQAENDFDPFPEFMYLDANDITKGLLAWIQIGINVTTDYTDNSYYSVAAEITDDGVTVTGSSIGGGGGSPPGSNGTVPGNGTAPGNATSTQ